MIKWLRQLFCKHLFMPHYHSSGKTFEDFGINYMIPYKIKCPKCCKSIYVNSSGFFDNGK